MKITIDLDKVSALVQEGKNIFLTPTAEKELVALLEIKDKVDAAISEAKKLLEAEALKISPNFSSIRSDQIKVYYREFGAKYRVDESRVGDLPQSVYSVKKSYAVNPKGLQTYLKEVGGLPLGIIENERKKQISIKLIEEKEDETQQ